MDAYYSSFIYLAVFVPLITGLMLLPMNTSAVNTTRSIALVGFVVPCIVSIWFAFGFYTSSASGEVYQALSSVDLGLEGLLGISLRFGLNGVSMPMFLLAGIVGLASGLYAIATAAHRLNLYLALLLIMLSGLMGTFASTDIFFFYFFHELALIPTFIMIGIWGGQGRRTAAMEMAVYLTLGAMISLVGLIMLYAQAPAIKTFNLIELKKYFQATGGATVLADNTFAMLLFGFGILVSLWPFHSWAPRGYAAAPSSAAMLHAGVLKKFGLYGLIQIAAPLLPIAGSQWIEVLIWLALGNIVVIGFITMAQRDLKLMVGYSSVMHMGYIFLGIATLSVAGMGGAILLMFAHGLSAALMFMLSTSVYRRTHSYDLNEMGGLGQQAPLLAGFFIAATMANIGLPGFANFWGEFTIFIALWNQYPWVVVPAATGVIISAVYGLRAVANIFFGEVSQSLKDYSKEHPITDIRLGERVPAIILLVALLAVGLYPKWMGDKLESALLKDYAKPQAVAPANVHVN